MPSEIAKTQAILLKMLIFVDRICTKNAIDYWIDGGTLLGAVRYQGFIPWDDDVDVCVNDNDFDELLVLLNAEVKKTKNYLLYNSCRSFPHFSEYLGDSAYLKSSNKLPVEIDIIRVKRMENSPEILKRDKRMVNLLAYHVHRPFEPKLNEGHEEMRFLQDKKFMRRSTFFNYFLKDYLESLRNECNSAVHNYCYNSMYVLGEREHYIHDDIFPLKRITFEGIEFKCPQNTHNYLTKLYGKNYMEPPPQEQRFPSSEKLIENIFPRFLIKKWIYLIYYMKEIKNNRRMKKNTTTRI